VTAVVLMNLGGPENLDSVPTFLYNLFSDPMIIELPGGKALQPAFARMIAGLRSPRVRRAYAQIGGGSPLRQWTQKQASSLEDELIRRGRCGSRVEVVMRYTPPRAEPVLAGIAARGECEVIALPLYPQECRATTGSSLLDLEQARLRVAPRITVRPIRSFHLHPGYLDSVVERIRQAVDGLT